MSGTPELQPAVLEAPVVSCETRILSVPLDPIIITANYNIVSVEMVLLRLRDADGITGYGCLWCFGRRQAAVLASVLEYTAPFACGKAPRDLARVTADLRREINFFGFKGVSVFGLAAVDMALHDLLCRRLGLSLSTLVGRRRDEVPIYWSGLFLNQTTEELVAETETVMAQGFRAIKFRVGKPTIQEDIQRLEAVLARVKEGTVLMLDAVQEWTPEEAIRASRRLADYDPLWLEDPLVHCDYPGLRRVVEQSPIPIATGENEYLREGFAQLLMPVAHTCSPTCSAWGASVNGSQSLRPRVSPPAYSRHTSTHTLRSSCAPRSNRLRLGSNTSPGGTI